MTWSRQRAGMYERVARDAARHRYKHEPWFNGRLRASGLCHFGTPFHSHSHYLGATVRLHAMQSFGERRLLRAQGNSCLHEPYFVVQRPL